MVGKKIGALAALAALGLVAVPVAHADEGGDAPSAGKAAVPVAPKAKGSEVKAPADMGKFNTVANGTLTDPAVIWAENFDELALPDWFSHTGPKGWKVESSQVDSGEKRWRGWTFTNVREWTWAAGNDERHWFTRGNGNFAVMESEHQRLAKGESFSTSLHSANIPVAGESDLVLEFDSHYRQGKAGQTGTVSISFDGGQARTLITLDKDDYTAHHELAVKVPAGSQNAQVTFSYNNSYNDKWWAIDNVAVRRPYKYKDDKPTGIIDIISDTHANPDVPSNGKKWARAMDNIAAFEDKGNALVFNGDFVDTMRDKNYFEAEKVMKAHPYNGADILWVSGNHEQYGQELSSEKAQSNFLTWAGRDKPYTEKVVGGIVMLALGTEYYDDHASQGKEPFWNASKAQLDWLKARLDYWEGQGRPVLLFTHYPFPNTVSGTHSAWYQNDYNEIEELNDILSHRKNLAIFTSHTHHIVDLNDWWGRYLMPEDVGAGIPVFNTGAVKEGIVSDGDNDERTLSEDHSSALRARVYDDHLTVEAWDMVSGKKLKEQTLPIGEAAAAGDEPTTQPGEDAGASKDEGDHPADPDKQQPADADKDEGEAGGAEVEKNESGAGKASSENGKNQSDGDAKAEPAGEEPKGSFLATTGAAAIVPTLLGAVTMIGIGMAAKLSRKKQ